MSKNTFNDGIVYAGFMVLGVCQTLPWNCFVNAYPYIMMQLSDNQTDYVDKHNNQDYTFNSFQVFWSSALGFLINGVQITSAVLNVLIITRVSRNARLYPSLIATCVCFILITIMTQFSGQPSFFFYSSLLLAVISQFGAGIAQACCFGLATMMPPKFIGAMYLGQAVAGLGTAWLSVGTMAIFPEDTPEAYQSAALMYFGIATFISIIIIPIYYFLNKNEQIQEQEKYTNFSKKTKSLSDDLSKLWSDIIFVGKTLKYQALSLMMIFIITLSVFPAVSQLVVSECGGAGTSNYCLNFGDTKFFVPVFVFCNPGDIIGRFLAGKFQIVKPTNGIGLLLLVLARGIFAGGFFMTRRNNFDGVGFMGTDWAYEINTTLFGLTGGYLSSLCFMFAPQLVAKEKQETAGSILPIFLCLGLLIGSCVSFGFVALVQ